MGPPRGTGPLVAHLRPLVAALALAGLAAFAGCGGDFTRPNPATADSAMIARFDANLGEFVMLARIVPRYPALEEVRQHYPGVIELVYRSDSGRTRKAQVDPRDFDELRHAMRLVGAYRVFGGPETGAAGRTPVSVHLDAAGRKGFVHRADAPPASSVFDADLDSVAHAGRRPRGTIYRSLLGGWYVFREDDRGRD
jgi:hypothetical protein